MEIVRDQKYDDRSVPVDGRRFESCVFDRSRLVFTGEGPVEFSGCTFIACNFVFDGAALDTLQYLATINDGLGVEGERLISSIFTSIQDGTLGEKLYASDVASAA